MVTCSCYHMPVGLCSIVIEHVVRIQQFRSTLRSVLDLVSFPSGLTSVLGLELRTRLWFVDWITGEIVPLSSTFNLHSVRTCVRTVDSCCEITPCFYDRIFLNHIVKQHNKILLCIYDRVHKRILIGWLDLSTTLGFKRPIHLRSKFYPILRKIMHKILPCFMTRFSMTQQHDKIPVCFCPRIHCRIWIKCACETRSSVMHQLLDCHHVVCTLGALARTTAEQLSSGSSKQVH